MSSSAVWQIICALLGKRCTNQSFCGFPKKHTAVYTVSFLVSSNIVKVCTVQMHHLICALEHILLPAPIPPLNEHPLHTKPGIFAPAPVSRAGGQDQRPRHSSDRQRLESMGAQNLDQRIQLIWSCYIVHIIHGSAILRDSAFPRLEAE